VSSSNYFRCLSPVRRMESGIPLTSKEVKAVYFSMYAEMYGKWDDEPLYCVEVLDVTDELAGDEAGFRERALQRFEAEEVGEHWMGEDT
jgi:hypothetical protein